MCWRPRGAFAPCPDALRNLEADRDCGRGKDGVGSGSRQFADLIALEESLADSSKLAEVGERSTRVLQR